MTMTSDDLSTPTSAATPNPAAPNLRVLLVDDQDDLLRMMNLQFARRSGYVVETAQSGRQAIEKVSDFCPHVVVSDIGMPGMDGIELMENLRRLEAENLRPFKAIALSGYDADGDTRVLDCGYDAHLTKPIDFETLVQTIEQMARGMGETEFTRRD